MLVSISKTVETNLCINREKKYLLLVQWADIFLFSFKNVILHKLLHSLISKEKDATA